MDDRFLDVDQHGALRPPLSMWFCVAFLLRHWLLVIFVAVTSIKAPQQAQWAYTILSPLALVMELPMWLLVVAWTRRVPVAGPWVRRLWRRGREIITLTAGLHLVWAMVFLWGQADWNPLPERLVAILALIDVFIIAGVWRSALYQQLFGEFPPVPSQKGSSP